MKPKFYLASFIGCFLVINAIAQKKQNVYFLKNNGKYVTERDSADFTRIVQEPDSGSVLYNVMEYYLNGNPRMLGKSSAIDPVRLEGQCVSFYPDKKKKRVGSYEKGMLTGEVYDYYPNGKLYRQSNYIKFADRKLFMPEEEKQSVQAAYDSTGTVLVKDGNGHYPIFDGNFKTIKEEGDVKDGKKNGIWKGTLNKGKVTFTEEYADGKFIKGTRTEETGNTINYTVKEALPSFKSGESGFGRYLTQNVHYPARAKARNIQGKVILSFTVEIDGSLTDFKILKSVDPEIDAEAIRVLSQSPKWNPGLQHGAAVNVAYTMPFNFALAGR